MPVSIFAKQEEEDIHRLDDLKVEEVSIVDRPANLRPFLVVKRDGGSLVVRDRDGNLVTEKSEEGKSDNGVGVLDSLSDEAKRFFEQGPAEKQEQDEKKKKPNKSSYEDDKERRRKSVDAALDTLRRIGGALQSDDRSTPDVSSQRAEANAEIEKKLDGLSSELSDLRSQVASQSKLIESQKSIIEKQGEKLSQFKKSRHDDGREVAAPSALRAEVRKQGPQEPDEVVWPSDMNDPRWVDQVEGE